jgi:glycine hydroxymethyltransferase
MRPITESKLMDSATAAAAFAESFRQSDLILYAGTNLLCPRQYAPDAHELGMMPAIGAGEDKQQPNVAALRDIEAAAAMLLCGLFDGEFAEARFQSCTQANLAVFIALLRAGDHVVCLHGNDGGHPSQNADGILAHLAVQLHAAPFDAGRQCVDDAALALLIERVRPRLVVLGASTILRPSTITRTAAAAAAVDAALVIDVSHVAGLIAGGTFPNPLAAGADFITASSYKTLGCPPAGFVVARTPRYQLDLQKATSPKLLSNYDATRLLRFASALACSRSSLGAYAQAIVANTQALRSALLDAHLAVVCPEDGVFGTHQILLSARSRDDAERIVADLQRAGVTTSCCALPGRWGSWAVRLGTQLVTRRGMGVEQMRRIAGMIAAVIGPAAGKGVRQQVTQLTDEFKTLFFCGETVALRHP